MTLTAIWSAMLNNRAKKDADKVLECLEIKRGDIIADIGSGGGYFAARFAERTGTDGKVFAIDTNRKLLSSVEKSMKKRQVYNVVPIMGTEEGFDLPEESCHMIFMRNVLHHIADPVSYISHMRRYLKQDGKIAIIEWLPDKSDNYVTRAGHCLPGKEIIDILEKAGFLRLKSFDFLKRQSFNLWKKAE